MENKFLFYQAVSALPEGLSLSDYEWNFYNDNAGKQILTVTLTNVQDGQTLVYDAASGQWINGAGGGGTGVNVTVGTVEPTSPTTGDIWFDTTDDTLYLFDGTVFAASVGPVGPKGDTGDTGATGPPGPTGVVAATLPITYDSGTETVAFDNTAVGSLTGIDYIGFDTAAAHDPEPGQISWDADHETLVVGLDAHVNLQVGQEHVVRVKNQSTTTAIEDGKAVMFVGATGDTVVVSPASSNGSYDSNLLVGVTTESIPADGFGFVTQFGFVNGIKTDYAGWQLGSFLYVDPTSPGDLTNTQPDSPAWRRPVAAVTRVQQSSGRILVRTLPSTKINSLDDVTITTPADGDFLLYNGTAWVNSPTVTWGDLSGA
jgi:hypothetical protein